MKTTLIPTCDQCAYYLTTGDSSGLSFYCNGEEYDEVVTNIDATLDAILADEFPFGSFVHESVTVVDNPGYRVCPFCDETHMDSSAITIQDGIDRVRTKA